MSNFNEQRRQLTGKHNEFVGKSKELNTQIESLDKKRTEIEEGISRIPTDLPEEIQSQVNAAIENVRNDLNSESDQLSKEVDDALKKADETQDMGHRMASDLQNKSQKMAALSGIPLIGSFAETKADELTNKAEQTIDFVKETQKYQDELAIQRNKLHNKR